MRDEQRSADTPHAAPDTAAQPTVLLLDNDLFFTVKVSDTLKHVGYVTQVVRTEADFARALATARPRIAIVNTAARGLDFRQAIARAREAGVPVVAFGAHVDTQTQAAAREAGAARVVSNAKLAEDLPGILDRTLRNAAAPDHDEEGGSSA